MRHFLEHMKHFFCLSYPQGQIKFSYIWMVYTQEDVSFSLQIFHFMILDRISGEIYDVVIP